MTTVSQDGEHLRLLSIFHYVVGGLLALFACIPLIHVAIGAMFLLHPDAFNKGQPQPFPSQIFGLMFMMIGGVFVLGGWLVAALIFTAGRFLGRHKHHTFCVVIAALSCVFFPFGTALGVFSLLVLLRPSVKEMFA
jgi:hypothetical protein